MAVDCRYDHHGFAIADFALMLKLLENVDQPRADIELLHLVAARRADDAGGLLAFSEGVALDAHIISVNRVQFK